MRSVIHVIVNRAVSWSKSIHEVVYGKNQFTSMSVPTDPEFNLEPTRSLRDSDWQAWLYCQGIVR